MRAYVMRGPGELRLAEVPDPACGADEVLMATEAVSICSTDISYYRGHLLPESWPIIPGHEYVGRVLEVGPLVDSSMQIGDRLVYWGQTDFGGMAELRTIRPLMPNQPGETSWYTERNFYDANQAAAIHVPNGMPSSTATLVEPLTSVLRSLLVNPPKPGDVCVVLGCGPSALLAIQVLQHYMAAGSVVVIDKDPARIQMALSLGADRGFNALTQSDVVETLIREHHDHFADYVFDALPHVTIDGHCKDVRYLGMCLLRPGGIYVIYGAAGLPQHIATWLILAKGLRLQASPFDVRLFPMARSAHVARVALGLIRDGMVQVQPLVSNTVSFSEESAVQAAFTNYGEGGSMKTSIVYESIRTYARRLHAA